MRYSYAFRHKDPVQCIIGSIAMYLFLRFDVGQEPWPSFGLPGFGWHAIKLLRNTTADPTKELTYSAQLKRVKDTFQQFNIHADGFTHAGRKAAVQHGEIIGVDDAQLRQLGHWDSTWMSKHYSAGIARAAARQFAGFPADRGNYYLPRSRLRPPESLRKKVFPRLEESLQMIESFPSEEQDKAAGGFLQTLDWFRDVILKDTPVLKSDSRFQGANFWRYKLFNDPEYLQYQINARQLAHEDTIPMAIQIQQLVPDIARELHSATMVLSGQLSIVSQSIDKFQNQVIMITDNQKFHNERLIAIENFADRMNRGQIKIVSYLQTDIDTIAPLDETTTTDTSDDQLSFIISSAAHLQTLPVLSSSAEIPPRHETSLDMPSSIGAESIPNYMVNISIISVEEAWEEWDEGLVSGPDGMRSPSIRYLEEKFGAKWRRTDASRQRYTRRMTLVRWIDRAAKNLQLAKSDAAYRIELWRRGKGITLDKTQKILQSYKDSSEPWGPNDIQLRHIH